uniref:Uncharacterized protein n=1 Tax=Cannabis sativa TaxID=3483 RepID=A0A803PR22_CANSA
MLAYGHPKFVDMPIRVGLKIKVAILVLALLPTSALVSSREGNLLKTPNHFTLEACFPVALSEMMFLTTWAVKEDPDVSTSESFRLVGRSELAFLQIFDPILKELEVGFHVYHPKTFHYLCRVHGDSGEYAFPNRLWSRTCYPDSFYFAWRPSNRTMPVNPYVRWVRQ